MYFWQVGGEQFIDGAQKFLKKRSSTKYLGFGEIDDGVLKRSLTFISEYSSVLLTKKREEFSITFNTSMILHSAPLY